MADHNFSGSLSVTGSVGIGTEPLSSAQLYVRSSSDRAQILVENSDGRLLKLAVDNNEITVGSDTGTNLPLNLQTNGSSRLSISANGNVGIGTSNPSERLEVDGTVKATAFQGDGSALTQVQVPDGSIATNKLVDGAATTLKIADNAVSSAKLANDSVGTGKLVNGAVTADKLALAARPFTLNGVSNPGGDVRLVGSDSITVVPENSTKQISIRESHSALTNNPHRVTATQVGALPLTGGTLTSSLFIPSGAIVNGLAIGMKPSNDEISPQFPYETISMDRTNWNLRLHSFRDIYLHAGNSRDAQLGITSQGQVNISTRVSSDYKLNIGGTGGQNALYIASDFDLRGNDRLRLIRFGNSGDYQILHKASGALSRNTLAMHVHRDDAFGVYSTGWRSLFEVEGGTGNVYARGNVGIGTETPNRALTVHSNGPAYLNVRANNGENEVLLGADGSGGIVSTMTDHDLQLRAGRNRTRMIIKANGNVGINASNPSERLEVSGIVKATSFQGNGSDLTNIPIKSLKTSLVFDGQVSFSRDRENTTITIENNTGGEHRFYLVSISGRPTPSYPFHIKWQHELFSLAGRQIIRFERPKIPNMMPAMSINCKIYRVHES